MSEYRISKPSPSRQVAFHQLLVGARKKWLADALGDALVNIDPSELRRQLDRYVPKDVQQTLAAAGIRDERVFPTPAILEAQPTLVGYYRLLLGVSQKAFYRHGTGMSRFKSMEVAGALSTAQRAALPQFCAVMAEALAELVREISPRITLRDVDELPLLTLGGQLQGASNVAVGKQASLDVFLGIEDVVRSYVTKRSAQQLTVENASGRKVLISLAGDPDVCIQEALGTALTNRVAIEIKGGTDVSNVHNRAGEAEKSHQKAKAQGFHQFWTVIMTKGVSLDKLRAESPTTTAWFDAAQILGRTGPDWGAFKERIAQEVGIPVS